jgi:putative two-component system response regulator
MAESPFSNGRSPRILLVDDEPINLKIVRKYLSGAGYEEFCSTDRATEALSLASAFQPDVVLLDVVMPELNGLDVLSAIRARPLLQHIPVVMLTASEDRATKCEALARGATDFLGKPVDPSELVSRIRNALAVKAHHDQLLDQTAELERLVAERTAQLEASHRNLIHCLARAAEFRDDDTGQHVLRVGRYAGIIARQLGWSDSEAEILELAAQLHDVGKIGIPDSILLKPGKLTPEEFEIIQKHCCFGKQVFDSFSDTEAAVWRKHAELGDKILNVSGSSVLGLAAQIALTHHEKWDGSGYPLALAGEDIPIAGRITAVADVFDALRSKRAYKPALPIDRCFAILEEGRGVHFDPNVLTAFFDVRNQIVEAQLVFAGPE